MIPGAAVVARPGGGITLRPGEGRARKHEGALASLQFQQALVGGAGVFHAENVMSRTMIHGGAVIQAMYGVEGHGFVGAGKDGRLIHVVPEAGGAHGNEILVQTSPPIAHASQSEIGEDAVTRPYFACVNRAVGVLHEHIVLDAGIVGRIPVVRIFLDVQVSDENGVKTLGAKIGNHLFESREVLAVDGERGVALLIVNVEINGVSGDFLVPKRFDNLAGARFRIIAVAALLIAKGPKRRQGRAPSKGRVLFHDFFWLGSGDEVIVQFAPLGAKRKVVARFLAKIERASIGVVKENAVSQAAAQSDKEGNGFVERVGGFLPPEFVSVPVGKSAVAAVHWPGFVSKTIVIFIGRHFLPDMNTRAIPGHGPARLVGEQDVAGSVSKGNEKGRLRYKHVDRAGGHLDFIFSILDLDRAAYIVQRRFSDGPRKILRKAADGSDAHAQNAVVDLCNPHFSRGGSQLHAILETVAEFLDSFYFANVLPALRRRGRAAQGASEQPYSYTSNQRSHVHPPDVGRE